MPNGDQHRGPQQVLASTVSQASVCNTEVAAMCSVDAPSRSPFVGERDAAKLVATVSRLCRQGIEASASVVQLTESLIWPFVARTSKRMVWFSKKDFDRLVLSFRHVTKTLASIESEDNKEQTYLKYYLDVILCRGFRDPQRPNMDVWMQNIPPLFVGFCRRFVNRAIAKRDLAFCYSLQKGSKRGWPSLGKEREAAALKKHAERLSQPRPPVPEDLRTVIQFTAREIFEGMRAKGGQKFMPTGSACMQAARSAGGCMSLVKPLEFPFEFLANKRKRLPTPSGRMGETVRDIRRMGILPMLNATIEGWRQAEYSSIESRAFEQMQPVADSFPPGLDVSIVALPEPGKFRIISLGDGLVYTALQPLQGLMLGAWKRHYASTMLRDDLTKRVREIDRALPDLSHWCSVDYEAATDLLRKDATLAAFEQIEGPSRVLGLASLFAGRANYPDGSVVEHCEGQLMGHPLSFPLLCAINLAVYRCAIDRWVAIDEWGRKEMGERMWERVLVNGDDMLFKCTHDFYDLFIQTAADAGFKVSQGKQYLSEDSCMINSQVFRRIGGEMVRIGYLNLKLVLGSSLKGGDSEATPTQVGKDLSKMISLVPWTACSIPKAFSRWKRDWFGNEFVPNWYLPVHLGGFGLDITDAPPSFRVTRSQRLMAARFINDPRLALYRKEGQTLPSAIIAGSLVKWRWAPIGPLEEGVSEESDDAWLARLAYSARAAFGSNPVSDRTAVAKLGKDYRLRPMSLEQIAYYRECRLVGSQMPICPPLRDIRIHDLDGSRWRTLRQAKFISGRWERRAARPSSETTREWNGTKLRFDRPVLQREAPEKFDDHEDPASLQVEEMMWEALERKGF